ncbi:anti-sigma factor [Burkholderia gladioli]|uniref:anti-sigma factor n=1 Tax=Burkholderia gladioli TaxID=28095 RepID=UPI0016409D59|nr:anti-sigma factor [Burkholderia gladioli]
MKVDETLLIAYTDGTLPPSQWAGVASLVATSAEAARIVRLLRASKLDYRAAFEAQALPPLPSALALDLDRLIDAHRDRDEAPGATRAVEASPNTAQRAPSHAASPPPPPSSPPPAPRLRPRAPTLPWLAAACVAGAVCAGLLLRAASGNPVSPWLAAAVGYQQLYTRDTLEYARLDANEAADAIAGIRARDHLDLRVPDLSEAGLQLRAVQRLAFRGRPLIQLVYLPRRGGPVALCVIAESKPDLAVSERAINRMRVVTWRRAALGYALIGAPNDAPGDVDLGALGRRLAAEPATPAPAASSAPPSGEHAPRGRADS